MPSFVSSGPKAESASSVVNPTILTPGVPAATVGDWLFCHTACTSTTATVATPSGWQVVYNVLGTAGRLVMFARRTDGTETAPSVVWSGVTTGSSGTPSLGRVHNWGTGFQDIAGTLIVHVLGNVSDQAASTTTSAGGAGITTTADIALVFAHGLRRDENATSIVEVGTGLSWTGSMADNTLSAGGMMQTSSWGFTEGPGSIGSHSWTITGGTSAISSGVIIAMAIYVQSEPGLVKYTGGMR